MINLGNNKNKKTSVMDLPPIAKRSVVQCGSTSGVCVWDAPSGECLRGRGRYGVVCR